MLLLLDCIAERVQLNDCIAFQFIPMHSNAHNPSPTEATPSRRFRIPAVIVLLVAAVSAIVILYALLFMKPAMRDVIIPGMSLMISVPEACLHYIDREIMDQPVMRLGCQIGQSIMIGSARAMTPRLENRIGAAPWDLDTLQEQAVGEPDGRLRLTHRDRISVLTLLYDSRSDVIIFESVIDGIDVSTLTLDEMADSIKSISP